MTAETPLRGPRRVRRCPRVRDESIAVCNLPRQALVWQLPRRAGTAGLDALFEGRRLRDERLLWFPGIIWMVLDNPQVQGSSNDQTETLRRATGCR